jgi:hypothetical protein
LQVTNGLPSAGVLQELDDNHGYCYASRDKRQRPLSLALFCERTNFFTHIAGAQNLQAGIQRADDCYSQKWFQVDTAMPPIFPLIPKQILGA